MPIQIAMTAVSALAVILYRTVTLAETPGDAAGQTITTLALAALMNVLVEFVKRWRSRSEQANDVADAAETIVDASGKLVTSQNANLDRFEKLVLRLDERIKGQDARIDTLSATVVERDAKIASQDEIIGNLERDNGALNDWVRRLTSNQEANIVRIKDLDTEVTRLRRENKESDAAHAQDKARMTAELRALSSGVDALTNQLRRLGHVPDWERSNGAQP